MVLNPASIHPGSTVMPDLQYHADPTTVPDQGLAEGHPTLAVEIVSPSSRGYDRVTKRAWYAQIGTPEYWIVDPEGQTLERTLLHDGELASIETCSGDTLFRPASFPGLEIPLAELWTLPPH